MLINGVDTKVAVDKIRKIRAMERKKAQLGRINILNGEVPIDGANVRLYRHFKELDRFNASSITRSGRKSAC